MDNNQAPIEPTISKRFFIAPILFFLLFILFAIGFIFIYKKYKQKKQLTQKPSPSLTLNS